MSLVGNAAGIQPSKILTEIVPLLSLLLFQLPLLCKTNYFYINWSCTNDLRYKPLLCLLIKNNPCAATILLLISHLKLHKDASAKIEPGIPCRKYLPTSAGFRFVYGAHITIVCLVSTFKVLLIAFTGNCCTHLV